ncbi:GTPase [Arcanobacterium bovis]|uniref:GTPase n=1 Tax=Arcanobacterium bovis TaxID=2529275 RepID=UPI0013F17838|nr:GTPase [Arcanobacterium bovis]
MKENIARGEHSASAAGGDDDVRVTAGDDDARVKHRLAALTEALDACENYVNLAVIQRARQDLAQVRERTEFGAGITVAALVGGTGSGKSTLFNAITGFDFADAGELRPTTERATACTWGIDTTTLLDYLGVEPSRRISHNSVLVDDSELNGLVLLDLPDHDSIRVAHSMLVGKLIPMIDVLVWVLDPQKYADQILHQQYLENLRQRSDSMIVVLNHIDTVPSERVADLLQDLRALLRKDGLGDVPVYPVSALHRIGLEPVHQEFEKAVQASSLAAQTALSEIDAISQRVARYLAPKEPELEGQAFEEIVDRVVRASGVPAVVASIADAGGKVTNTALVAPDQPSHTMIVAIRDAWTNYVSEALPPEWREAVVANVSGAERLRRSVGHALKEVALPKISRTSLWLAMFFAFMLVTAGCIGVAVGFPSAEVPVRVGMGAGGVAIALAVWWLARNWHKRSVVRASQQYAQAVHRGIEQILREQLVSGPYEVVSQHRRAREMLEA